MAIKFFKTLNEQNIAKEIEEEYIKMKKEGSEINSIHQIGLTETFIINYETKDITKPPLQDLQRDIHTDVPPFNGTFRDRQYQHPYDNNFVDNLKIKAREHWYVTAFVIVAAFYYFFKVR